MGIFNKTTEDKDIFSEASKEAYRSLETNLNIHMDDDGFVDKKVIAIYNMINKGKDIATIAEFFDISANDVKAVIGYMDEHNKRLNTYSESAARAARAKAAREKPENRTNKRNTSAENKNISKNEHTKVKYPEATGTQKKSVNPAKKTNQEASVSPVDSETPDENNLSEKASPKDKMREFALMEITSNNNQIKMLNEELNKNQLLSKKIDNTISDYTKQLNKLKNKINTYKKEKSTIMNETNEIKRNIIKLETENKEFELFAN